MVFKKRSGDKWLNHLFTVLFFGGGGVLYTYSWGVHQPESVFKNAHAHVAGLCTG